MLDRITSAVALGIALTATSAVAQGNPPAATVDIRVRFDNHLVVRAMPRTERELQTLLKLTPDVWSHGISVGPIDVRIAPERRAALDASGIPYDVLIPDVQQLIDREARTAGRDQVNAGLWFEDYKTYDQINAYLDELAALQPGIATVFTIGTSIEGRAIKGIEITGTTPGPGVPGVLFNGIQHAREWVAGMTTTYIADQLIRQYGLDPVLTALVDTHVFYIIPVVNVDGYVYTWTNNRLWRKNRRNNGNGTFGIDINRNWSYKWGGIGASHDPGSDLYCGSGPFSEPETAALRDFMLDRPWIVRHVDIHSYSQYVLYPWAWTPNPCIDGSIYTPLAQDIANVIRSVHGVPYSPGPWYTRLYPSSGVMQDYTYQERAAWGFTFELRDTGQYGFLLPANQILPTAEEIFAGAIHLVAANLETRMLLEATELARGQQAILRAHRGTPGRQTYFVYSFSGYGTMFVPQLNVTLNLDHPTLIGASTADQDGVATIARTVPNNTPLRDILIQATQRERRSNVAERTIE